MTLTKMGTVVFYRSILPFLLEKYSLGNVAVERLSTTPAVGHPFGAIAQRNNFNKIIGIPYRSITSSTN